MTSQDQNHGGDSPIPKLDIPVLKRCLKEGHLAVSKAADEISHLIADALKAIGEHSDDVSKAYNELGSNHSKLKKCLGDVTEKCQGMQQALLYKEEKYDEKCRECARYKAICEMSAKAAFGDNQYISDDLEEINNDNDNNNNINNNSNNNNSVDYNGIYGSPNRKDRFVKDELRQADGVHIQNLKSHMKLSQTQMHLSQYVAPLRPSSLRSNPSDITLNDFDGYDQQSAISHYYAGGPCKRKIPLITRPAPKNLSANIRERMELIGGINVTGPRISTGPVDSERLVNKDANNSPSNESHKRVKIDLTSQRNEVMSSSGNLASQMRNRIVERDLHRQVAGGCFTRLASRRKKDWPF